ncbi:MAG: hypothetical protein ACYTHM_09900 [Planctomycetota bacterium]|jgi:hypothetical protein
MKTTLLLIGFLISFLSGLALAGDREGWHRTLEEGQKEAKRSRQAVLYVTKWKPGT